VTDFAALTEEIRELAERKNAVILAHNYQRAEVQDAADFVGDSLGLSRQAAQTDAGVIVFAGVHFMAETAKILAPEKTVLLPEPSAGCPMADMVTGEALRAWKAQHPGVPVVTYVNSSADVKAESDVCVTSANAVAVVRALDEPRILFAPDRNLGSWVARSLPGVEVELWEGWCPTHDEVTTEQVLAARAQHPEARVMAHPECRPEVVDLADAVLSTSQMLRYAAEDSAGEFIVVTESGLVHGLRKAAPGKRFFELEPRMLCPNMKVTTLEKVHRALAEGLGEVTVPADIAQRARRAVERMVAIG
jgi:quinolinate synthase